jgi:hypothetical protein
VIRKCLVFLETNKRKIKSESFLWHKQKLQGKLESQHFLKVSDILHEKSKKAAIKASTIPA